MRTICYPTFEAKARDYLALTLPAIFEAALTLAPIDEAALRAFLARTGFDDYAAVSNGVADLARLHEAVRRLLYVSEDPRPCDDVKTMHELLTTGGDCEDYASLLLAVFYRAGVDALLVTAGDARDNFRHVWVAARAGDGAWRHLDPKGNQRGEVFGVAQSTPSLAIRRFWNVFPLADGGHQITEIAR